MDLLRQYVGGPKNRYKDDKFNLDLTYITPRLIAMAFPASGIEKLYRNPIDTVKEFLTEHHGIHYLIVNLSGREVDESILNNVLTYDWEDHQAPPLEMLFDVCAKISDFLQSNFNNVVAVNCNHGKGRTGTVICCFLLYCNMFKDSEITMDFYAKKRFEKEEGYGVTQPCQIQYIRYFEILLKNPLLKPRVIAITKIIFKGETKHETLYIKAKKFNGQNIFTTKKSHSNTLFHKNVNESQQHEQVIIVMDETYFCGDCKFYLKSPGAIGSSSVGSYSFNTAFLEGDRHRVVFNQLSPYSLRKTDNFGKDFAIQFEFKNICNCPRERQLGNNCNKCGSFLMDEQLIWKGISNIIGRRRNIEQRARESMLGYHLKNNTSKIEVSSSKIEVQHHEADIKNTTSSFEISGKPVGKDIQKKPVEL